MTLLLDVIDLPIEMPCLGTALYMDRDQYLTLCWDCKKRFNKDYYITYVCVLWFTGVIYDLGNDPNRKQKI